MPSLSPLGRGRGDGGFVRQTSYEETRGEGGGSFGRGIDTRRQGWNENRWRIVKLLFTTVIPCMTML